MTSSNLRIEEARELLRADYAHFEGTTFEHFYCPILHTDSPGELCMGHVINEAIPNSYRAQVLQRKDLDGWYGSLFESQFSAYIHAKKSGVADVFADRDLSRVIRPKIEIDGVPVKYYRTHKGSSTSDLRGDIQIFGGEPIPIALKLQADAKLEDHRVQLVMERDFIPEATATLLKAAHLSMFRCFGYKYVFGTAGLDLATILRDFYSENRDKPRADQKTAAIDYFRKHTGMITPLFLSADSPVLGTVEDRRLILLMGSSGHPFAVGVVLRTDDRLFVVYLCNDRAESLGSYFDFIAHENKPVAHGIVVEFVDDGVSAPHWKQVGPPSIRFQMLPTDQ